ncbi:MAG: molybdopterin-guanine dinucleotide biosynthesis protein B [Dehalococcoidales bacterium]|nr:molybdopterin-guanine dinucleotide biosynthesis protein B [Dehalococcoidales bacterium]
MAAIVSFIGKSNSGKTTLLEKVIGELTSRKYRIATIKHTAEEATLDTPGKDTWRHLRAGSKATAIGSDKRIVLIKPVKRKSTVEEMARLLGEDYDLIITEGFKQGPYPKIEVHRKEIGAPLTGIKNVIAIATDESLETDVRQFSIDDHTSIADFIEDEYIKPQSERLSLYVNDELMTLSAFPHQIITNLLLAIATSLKGVNRIKNLKFFYRK